MISIKVHVQDTCEEDIPVERQDASAFGNEETAVEVIRFGLMCDTGGNVGFPAHSFLDTSAENGKLG